MRHRPAGEPVSRVWPSSATIVSRLLGFLFLLIKTSMVPFLKWRPVQPQECSAAGGCGSLTIEWDILLPNVSELIANRCLLPWSLTGCFSLFRWGPTSVLARQAWVHTAPGGIYMTPKLRSSLPWIAQPSACKWGPTRGPARYCSISSSS